MTATTSRPSVTEAIETRRSVRQYVQEPMNQDDLREILRLASLAPTSNNIQPTRFVVVQDAELKNKLMEASFNQQQIGNAPAVIAVYSDMEDFLSNVEETVHPGVGPEQVKARAEATRQNFLKQDVAQRGQMGLTQANIVFGFLMLAAKGLGYDTNPMGGFDRDKVRELLGLPAHAQLAGLLTIGHGTEEGFPHHRHSVERITKFM